MVRIIPSTPKELGLDDFESFRPMQRHTIQRIVKSLYEDDNELVFLESATGSGKSVVAMATAMAADTSSMTLTTSKQLQQQYLDSFPFLVSMKGRNNFNCALQPEFTCDLAPCAAGEKCAGKWDICPYYMHKREAMSADHVVSNIWYFLNEANYVGDFTGRGLLVIDEGHLLESVMMGFVSIDITPGATKAMGVHMPSASSIKDLALWAETVQPVAMARFMEARVAGDIKALLRAKSFIDRLERIISIEEDKWIMSSSAYGITVKPVWVSSFGDSLVFKHGTKKIIMSATIRNPQQLARCLGAEGRYDYIEIGSLFPTARRPINLCPVASINARSTPHDYEAMADAIDDILEKHQGQKGVLHTVSYKLAKEILSRTRNRGRFMSHNSDNTERVMSEFMESNDDPVLISPSASTGVDLPDDKARFQIIAKIPFGDLGDQQVRIRKKEDPSWYSWNAACTLIQMTGRSTRSAKDYSVNYILDKNALWFMKANDYLFPPWWKKSVFKINDINAAIMPKTN